MQIDKVDECGIWVFMIREEAELLIQGLKRSGEWGWGWHLYSMLEQMENQLQCAVGLSGFCEKVGGFEWEHNEELKGLGVHSLWDEEPRKGTSDQRVNTQQGELSGQPVNTEQQE